MQKVPHCSNPQNPNQNPIEHPSTMSPASNASKEAVTVGTRLFFAKDPSYFPKTQPGPKCSSTDVEPAAPETQPLQLAHKVKDVEPIAMHAGD